jgi:hypothetical protein
LLPNPAHDRFAEANSGSEQHTAADGCREMLMHLATFSNFSTI